MNENKKGILLDPQPALQFIFAMFALFTWLNVLVEIPEDSAITMGILEISLGIAAFAGSILNLIRGDQHGNINLILSVILGFSGGITQIVSTIAHHIPGMVFHPWISSVVLLFGGLYMACFLPMLGNKPFYQFISHLCVVIGFLCSSLSMLLSVEILKFIGAWFLFVFALTALYGGINNMYIGLGYKFPQGKSLFQLLKKSSN